MRRAAAALLVLVLGACGDGQDAAPGESPAVYVSLPLQGAVREQTTSMVDGARLALDQARKRGDDVPRLVVLDDATATAGAAETGQVSSNARRAVADGRARAYIGEFDSGATAVSLPITNAGGLLQLAPTSTYIGLTQRSGRAGEPESLQPSGRRTFARLAPADDVQAGALLRWQRDSGCDGVAILDDGGVYGRGLARLLAARLDEERIERVDLGSTGRQSLNFRATAQRFARSGVRCFTFAGTPASRAAQVWRDVHAVAPDALLFGPDALADPTFVRELGRSASRTRITAPVLAPDRYPKAARDFFASYERRFGRPPAPAGIYGFEAMASVLAALRKAGPDPGRADVVQALFSLRRRGTPLGDYGFLPRGDSTIRTYGGFRVRGGDLAFDRVLRAG